ncbi:MAG: acetolactate synthase small subunit [Bacteroidales bacterium]|jgi:acetolactate synthase-1/3 small subunit|nr:acetolactate synthase small subunit [Bacteroidales bacterium]
MKKEYIVIAFVNNQISVLNRITSAYLKRHINIESLNVSESFIKGISTVVISAVTTADETERIVNQLGNVIDIHKVDYFSQEDLIYKEMALYKIPSTILKDKSQSDYILNHSNSRIIEMGKEYLIVEKSGSRIELEKLKSKLERKKLLAGYSRSGNVVLHREYLPELLHKVS